MDNAKFQRDLFRVSSRTAKSRLGGSFHDLHIIATIEIEKLERKVAKLEAKLKEASE
jgi:hypothetical protein